ncbi:hypothetical protein [Maribacter polysaccharolyticus]|uniref:hypothetical protein n=1 Tax=Maribacter polysaccharolyticus TaxID=3020831 RepID=UPI00237FBDEE|nr:hypothetical protein [Maribacter polysaccharolyticus]MDE3740624.1 hypothetical protein [Maribacter polysaccharolyticus]
MHTLFFSFDHSLIKFEDNTGQFANDPLCEFGDTTPYNQVFTHQYTDFKLVKKGVCLIKEESEAINKVDLNHALNIPFDILGTDRTENPDIGAHEFTPRMQYVVKTQVKGSIFLQFQLFLYRIKTNLIFYKVFLGPNFDYNPNFALKQLNTWNLTTP